MSSFELSLTRFKDGRTRHYTTRIRLLYRVCRAEEDRDFCVGDRTGLCLSMNLKRKTIVRLYTKKDGLPNNIVSSLLQTRTGALIGTDYSLTEYTE